MNTRIREWAGRFASHILKVFSGRKKTYSLDDMLEGVTADNRHGEWDMGAAVGNEVW